MPSAESERRGNALDSPGRERLDPDEQLWAHVQRRLSKQCVQGKAGMQQRAPGALHRIQKLPVLLKSFFRQQDIRDAAYGIIF